MKNSRENYTERQIAIIENIGTIFMRTIAVLFWFAVLTVHKDKEIISQNTFIKKRTHHLVCYQDLNSFFVIN